MVQPKEGRGMLSRMSLRSLVGSRVLGLGLELSV